MILYHFTTLTAVPSILTEGLTRGEAPLSDTRIVKAVNLTTDSEPGGHGLDGGGRVVTVEESAIYAARLGWDIPAGTVFADKTEVRMTIKLPSSDRALKPWLSWARKKCEPGYADRLIAAAGGGNRKAKTWWLYFGRISPDCITEVRRMSDGALLSEAA